jgi:hypothetical protein
MSLTLLSQDWSQISNQIWNYVEKHLRFWNSRVEHGCDEKVKISKILWDCPFKELKTEKVDCYWTEHVRLRIFFLIWIKFLWHLKRKSLTVNSCNHPYGTWIAPDVHTSGACSTGNAPYFNHPRRGKGQDIFHRQNITKFLQILISHFTKFIYKILETLRNQIL